jgi:hypothetical protein
MHISTQISVQRGGKIFSGCNNPPFCSVLLRETDRIWSHPLPETGKTERQLLKNCESVKRKAKDSGICLQGRPLRV